MTGFLFSCHDVFPHVVLDIRNQTELSGVKVHVVFGHIGRRVSDHGTHDSLVDIGGHHLRIDEGAEGMEGLALDS